MGQVLNQALTIGNMRTSTRGSERSYFDELCAAMTLLSGAKNAVFLGQGVADQGTTMADTFCHVPASKRLEMPVAEELQCGMAIGMALGGYLPICVYPRYNFMLRAMDQIINHLDRLPLYSDGGYAPKVIIRTAVPSSKPFNPGPQHDDDFTGAFKKMLRTVKVETLHKTDDIMPAYAAALRAKHSTLLVEFTEHYKDERGK